MTKGIKSTGFVGEYWRVGISGDCSQIPVKIERRKCEKRSDWKDVLVSNIKEIKSVGDKDYIGFMVDGNNRFLLGDFTVTHNITFSLFNPTLEILLFSSSTDHVGC